MSPVQHKPIIHGRDHAPGGADPIHGLVPAAGTYSAIILAEPTLWAYWPMDDPTGSTTVADIAGNSRDLGVHGTPTFEQTGPFTSDPALTSILFDGTNANDSYANDNLGYTFATGEAAAVFSGTQPHTFEIWVYPTVSKSEAGILHVWDGASASDEIVWLNTLAPTYKRAANLAPGTAIALNTWVHLAVTYDGTTQRLYLDGALIGSTAGGSLTVGGLMHIGAWREQPTTLVAYFNGRLCQAALYTSALGASTLADHADAATAGGDAGGTVLTSDGAGGTTWAHPTVKVDGTRYNEILTGTNLTSTNNTDGTVTIDATGGATFDPATATTWWFPLADSDGILVLDANGALIPTLIPL